ncbi:hypothetical protein [Verrucosispora sp. WMMC514]|uniref:hypothetical protein n=1 Tax=Verrucosispora sp. WMMC514 TaxID=3015156 RepID=UPI00248B5E70|nr:hypothetical protein [Verrucosispora sp. WMMC514]WBB91443.1 hypothetical protein O7597_31555 [Verrucosispora sp. WMMC514]WBB91474.1 hypothetical protein O7597_00010 [Verrucosispora sp. WMMC514]
MKTRRLVICRRRARSGAGVGGDVYGLIDWDDAPILIVGSSVEAVKREAIRIFARTLADTGSLAEDAPDFTDRYPLPDPDGPIEAIDDWLTRLRRATAIPWFAVLDDEVVIAQ